MPCDHAPEARDLSQEVRRRIRKEPKAPWLIEPRRVAVRRGRRSSIEVRYVAVSREVRTQRVMGIIGPCLDEETAEKELQRMLSDKDVLPWAND